MQLIRMRKELERLSFGTHQKKKPTAQDKMNDLVFVMYDLKLKERQMRRDAKAALEFQDIDSDDEWITEKEDPVIPLNNDWLHSLDRITRREARVAADENSDHEVQTIAKNLSDACGHEFGLDSENEANDGANEDEYGAVPDDDDSTYPSTSGAANNEDPIMDDYY